MPLSNYIISKQEKKSRENINLKLTLLRIGESLVSSRTLGINGIDVLSWWRDASCFAICTARRKLPRTKKLKTCHRACFINAFCPLRVQVPAK